MVSQAIGRHRSDADAPIRLALHSLAMGWRGLCRRMAAFFICAPTPFPLMARRTRHWRKRGSTSVVSRVNSFIFLVVMMVTNSVFRAHGDGLTSAAFMVLATAVNIAINPVLIFGWGPIPQLGTEGAALATAIGRPSARLRPRALRGPRFPDGLTRQAFQVLFLASARQIVAVGVPAAGSNAINAGGHAFVTEAVATFGRGDGGRIRSRDARSIRGIGGPVRAVRWGSGRWSGRISAPSAATAPASRSNRRGCSA